MTDPDVAIVGAGITGLSCAYYIARLGLRVRIIERQHIGEGASGHGGGHIAPHVSPGWSSLGALALRLWPTLISNLPSPTGYVQAGGLHLIGVDDALDPEAVAEYRQSQGFVVHALTAARCQELVPPLSRALKGGVFSPKNAQADPLLTTRAIALAVRSIGVEICTGTHVTGIQVAGNSVVGLNTSSGDVSTRRVILATGPWAPCLAAKVTVSIPCRPERVALMTSQQTQLITPVLLSKGGLYCRQGLDRRFYFGADGGSTSDLDFSFSRHVTFDDIHHAASSLLSLIPGLDSLRLVAVHARTVDSSPDELPIIGACSSPRGLFVAVGLEGHGFTLAPAVGRIISQLVTDHKTDVDITALSPDRFRSARD